ncbi:Ig-like domain-containing protein [Taibaiella soli]|uniref:Ig-like domain-containing protein n=1 Tax=Taibaiella soli TaxID=1649169 RepID=A0A2W2AJ01_9BACT|nr:T9SS type A sorting domain-containing protein [Taibaiella soli]PZF73552.1 hypothetical protein DN068_07450 [Taibaiella soli]
MKLPLQKALIGLCLVGATTSARAQLSGTLSVPSATYPTIASVVSALNTQGVGAGGVTVNVTAGYTETLTAALSLTATGTSANQITFQKSGTGANPLITAYANTSGTATAASATIDGIWNFVGSDYVTINGIDLSENSANNTAAAAAATQAAAAGILMEYGYAFFKTSATDGAQNNMVKNCTVTLNRLNWTAAGSGPLYPGSAGIEVMNCTPAATQTSLTVSAVSGRSMNNKFYSNTVQNCNVGIALSGYAASSPYTLADTSNDIGGSSVTTANTVINFGGGTSATQQSIGIAVRNQWNFNASYNTVNSNNGSGVNHPYTLRGMYFVNSAGASGSANNNTVTVAGGGSSQSIYAIDMEAGNSANSNTVNVVNNTIQNSAFATSSSGSLYGIYVSSTATAVNVNNNTFSGNSVTTANGSFQGIYNNDAPANLSINNNTFSGAAYGSTVNTGTQYFIYNSSTMTGTFTINGNTFQNCTNMNTSGDVYFIYNNNSTPSYSVQNNKFNNLSRASTLGGNFYGHYNNGGGNGTATLSYNTFNNITSSGSGLFYGLHSTTSSSQSVNYTGNKFTNLTLGSGSAYMIYNTYGNVVNINNDTINNISTGGDLYPIFAGSGSTINANVYSNIINTISTSGANSIYGIYLNASASGAVTNAYKNKVYDFSATNAGGKAYGIYASSSATHTIYNNLVGDIKAPAATDPNAVVGIYISSVNAANVYNNTVYLSATSSGATFGSSALYVSSTSPSVTSRNNILVNNSTPGATSGYSAAFRYTAAPGSAYQNVSNNNLFYAGTAAANHLIYGEGASASATNGQQTLAGYKSYIGNARDTFSVTENPNFASTTGSAANYLHFAAGTSTYAESGGANVSGITDDYDGDIRQGNPGYTGTGTAPDIGADEFNGTPLTPSINTIAVAPGTQCEASAHTVTANVSPAPGGSITSVTLTYAFNGTAQTPITMTGGSTTTTSNWTATIPAATPGNAVVTWSVLVYDGSFTKTSTGTSYSDAPMLGLTATASATLATVCAGSPSVLKVNVPAPSVVGAGALTTSGSGGSSGNYVSPFSHYYGGYKGQYMIRASELTAAGFAPGDFTALAFDVTSVGTTYAGFAINMLQTTNTDLSAGFNLSGLQQVYNTSATPVVGINTYAFTAPFTWDGTSNIVVQVCWSNNNTGGTASEVKYDNTSFIAEAYYRADNTSVATMCGNTSNTGTVSARPKMVLTGNKGNLTYSWSNGSSVVGITSPLTVTPASTTSYTATVKDVNNCTITSNAIQVTVTPLPASPTVTNTTQCGVGVPTVSVSGGTGIYKWYSAATGGTLLQRGGNTYTGVIGTTTTFYVVDSSGLCESARVAVTATVTIPDSINAKANGSFTPPNICLGSPVNLSTVKNGTTNTYTYKWTANPTTGSNIPATGTTGQNITVTPTAAGTYVYTVTGSDATCTAVSSVTVNVINTFANTPLATSATKPTICAGDADSLKASITAPFFTETFESASFPLTTFVTGSVSGTPTATQNTTYFAQGSSSVLFNTASASADVSLSSATSINLTQYSSAKLTFSQIAALEGSSSSYDYGYVQYSTDGGTTWTSFPTSSYAGTGTLFNSVVSFSTLSYSNWTSTLSSATATPTNSLWQNETINIPAAAMTSTQFKVRFRYTTDGSVFYYGWLIDNIQLIGTYAANVSWANGATVIGTANPQPVTPTSTTTYTPTITYNGCTTTAPTVTVTVNPLPTATITPSAATTICAGNNIVLTAGAGTGYTYQWQLNGAAITGATANTYTATAAGNYTVVATSLNCSATSAATVITVTPLPTATATAAGATSFCTGGSVVLNANTGTGLTYVWKRNGTNITGATTASYTATTTGAYTVTVTSNSCSATSTAVNVTVLAPPTATVSVFGNTTFCQGDSALLVANVGAGLSYVWKRNGVSIAGATNSMYHVSLAGTYTVDVNNGACTTTSNSVVITVNPLPTVTTAASGPTGFCEGGSVTLTASPATGLTYIWKENGNVISGATNASYTATQTGAYTVTASNGTCSNTSSPVNVTAYPIPVATITPLTATTICTNDTAVLQAPGGTGYVYQWYLNGNAIAGANGQIYSTNTPGSYTVEVTTPAGCTATSTTAVTITTFVAPNTVVAHTGSLAVCEGSSVTLSVTTGIGYTYQWYKNSTLIYGATNSDYTVVSQAGTYTVRVTTPNGCSGISLNQVVTVLPLMYPIISISGTTLSTSGFTAYQWYLNNTPIPGATNASYTVEQDGYYTVLGTAPNGCPTMSAIASIQFLGIETVKAEMVKIYPNPSSSKVYIDAPKDVNVALCAVDGRVLDYVKKAKQIDISNYTDGVYMIRVLDENDVLIKIEKLVKASR